LYKQLRLCKDVMDDVGEVVLGRTSFLESHIIRFGVEKVAASFFKFGKKAPFQRFL